MRHLATLALFCLLCAPGVLAQGAGRSPQQGGAQPGGPAQALQLAWWPAGRAAPRAVVLRANAQAQPAPAVLAQPVPLASLWKLFVHLYTANRPTPLPDYLCRSAGQRGDEEQYCCTAAGERVDAATALARSCGAYFAPSRVAIDLADWQRFWTRSLAAPPDWLLRGPPQADTRVRVADVLDVLHKLPRPVRAASQQALLETVVAGRAQPALAHWGGRWRVKTFTWREASGGYHGGAAGWLLDGQGGTPVWFAGAGGSHQTIARWATALEQALPVAPAPPGAADAAHPPPGAATPDDADCIHVRYFARYPLRQLRWADGSAVPLGQPLHGPVVAQFANGNRLVFRASGQRLEASGPLARHPSDAALRTAPTLRGGVADLAHASASGIDGDPRLATSAEGAAQHLKPDAAPGPISLIGTHALEDYVARVVQREGDARQPQAARALALLARSFAVQHAGRDAACWRIDDASHLQRVAPEAPGPAARAAALWSAGLVLQDVVAQYRLRADSSAAPGLPFLAWQTAVQQEARGLRALDMLHSVWPRLRMASLHGASDCERLDAYEQWLAAQSPRWQRLLAHEAGFEPPAALSLCALRAALPYADLARQRIYVHGNGTLAGTGQTRTAIVHEWLHFAFVHHPRGQDEAFIETTAQRLLAAPDAGF